MYLPVTRAIQVHGRPPSTCSPSPSHIVPIPEPKNILTGRRIRINIETSAGLPFPATDRWKFTSKKGQCQGFCIFALKFLINWSASSGARLPWTGRVEWVLSGPPGRAERVGCGRSGGGSPAELHQMVAPPPPCRHVTWAEKKSPRQTAVGGQLVVLTGH